jgi:hypothetical protein
MCGPNGFTFFTFFLQSCFLNCVFGTVKVCPDLSGGYLKLIEPWKVEEKIKIN